MMFNCRGCGVEMVGMMDGSPIPKGFRCSACGIDDPDARTTAELAAEVAAGLEAMQAEIDDLKKENRLLRGHLGHVLTGGPQSRRQAREYLHSLNRIDKLKPLADELNRITGTQAFKPPEET